MPFCEANGLSYFQFDALQEAGVRHAVFTRLGGLSPVPWRSLNVGGTVGDDPERVVENRRRTFGSVGLDPGSIYDVWQVHSADAVLVDGPRAGRELRRADIMLTRSTGVTLFMRFADCVPILIVDPRLRAAALAHAGWQGTVKQAARVAVEAMKARFGSEPSDLVAGLGPAIGPDHYEVGEDVIRQFQHSFGEQASRHLHTRNGRSSLDLVGANRALLEACGVKTIEDAGICTACSVDHWYSHRAEAGRTGRFGALLYLEPS